VGDEDIEEFQSQTGSSSHFDGYPNNTALEAKKARVLRASLLSDAITAARAKPINISAGSHLRHFPA